ncbi:MAG: hypothetical protein Q7S86_01175 [bacterium]|nr:hypothetical protein [bacterium]
MVFLLKVIINNSPYNVGVIVADNPEVAARMIGREVRGKNAGPKGQSYFDLTGEFGESPYFTMNSMPEITSVAQLAAFL